MDVPDESKAREHVVATWAISSKKERKFALLDAFIASFAIGLAVGVVYYFTRVKAPAPPLIALFGLLGMVVGEKLPPFVQSVLNSRQ